MTLGRERMDSTDAATCLNQKVQTATPNPYPLSGSGSRFASSGDVCGTTAGSEARPASLSMERMRTTLLPRPGTVQCEGPRVYRGANRTEGPLRTPRRAAWPRAGGGVEGRARRRRRRRGVPPRGDRQTSAGGAACHPRRGHCGVRTRRVRRWSAASNAPATARPATVSSRGVTGAPTTSTSSRSSTVGASSRHALCHRSACVPSTSTTPGRVSRTAGASSSGGPTVAGSAWHHSATERHCGSRDPSGAFSWRGSRSTSRPDLRHPGHHAEAITPLAGGLEGKPHGALTELRWVPSLERTAAVLWHDSIFLQAAESPAKSGRFRSSVRTHPVPARESRHLRSVCEYSWCPRAQILSSTPLRHLAAPAPVRGHTPTASA